MGHGPPALVGPLNRRQLLASSRTIRYKRRSIYMLRRLVFTLPLIACAVLAQTPPPPMPLPVAPPVKPELATPVPDHSQEAYVGERYKDTHRFEIDGTGRHEVSARIKVQSEAGVEGWGQLVVGY